ncbi:hypothetical protein [Kitasatospora sp. SUK 42]|uniref:hypothetical protein n=1 Tax=Kitasatospora sp. SUK 42 TaxID=1588882 RepID=UPI0018CB45A8|nr:hypothetical protein [Kitasatospora sp. SUK 42]MBV2153175.1 hypothetical protein [Kitasatospora sp. SUK 42]
MSHSLVAGARAAEATERRGGEQIDSPRLPARDESETIVTNTPETEDVDAARTPAGAELGHRTWEVGR